MAADGAGRFELGVHPPGSPSGDVSALVAFAARQPSVRAVAHRPDDGTIVVEYDERTGAAALLRGALLERLRAGRPARPAKARLEVSVVHELRGRVRLKVGGSHADAVGRAVERLAAFVADLPGVERARPSPGAGTVLVSFDPSATSKDALLRAIEQTAPGGWPRPTPQGTRHHEVIKTGFAAAVLGASITGALPAPVLLGGVAITAIPPFRRAFENLARRHVNVDVMDATAITVCLLRGEPITAAVLTTLLALGDLILERTQDRARTAISRLMQLDDGEAFVLDEHGEERRVHPRELHPGVRIVVHPGARVPADGVLVEGSLSVDEKAITGESVPRDRLPGDHVMAASVVLHGQATVVVERAGGDTVAARIVQILEGAGAKPMTLQKNAERSADRLVVPTFATAGIAWAASGVVDRLTSVLITDFGTGVRVAVPTAALAAMVEAARAGVLVKGAQFLERLAEVDTIVFDKTGTLTLGHPRVTRLAKVGGWLSEVEIAAFAAAAEGNQTHPIADAIRQHAVDAGAPHWHVDHGTEDYRIGLGLEARVRGRLVHIGNPRMMRELGVDPSPGERVRDEMAQHGTSSVLVAVDREFVGVIGYADAPRPESIDVIRTLRAGGRRKVVLLSGDARAPVLAIARHCGIDDAIGEVLPQDKADVVRKLKAEGRKVAMVGDGINDAPALAVADVGVSLHGGTEVALETADVVLLEGGLERLPEVFGVAERAMARVKEVLGIVLAPNTLAIAAGALGLINPITAATVNNGSTIAASLHAVLPLLRRARA